MTILTNLAAQSRIVPDNHPISRSIRAGYHTSPNVGESKFIGIFTEELHLHCGKSMIVIPLEELWKLAEKADPNFKKPDKTLSPPPPQK